MGVTADRRDVRVEVTDGGGVGVPALSPLTAARRRGEGAATGGCARRQVGVSAGRRIRHDMVRAHWGLSLAGRV
jgi:hypothetical protein